MNRIKLPISEILVEDRQRQDLGDIDKLAESLATLGLIQPIVVNQAKRLIAGGRRLTAARKLGWKEIDVVYRETLSEDECYELELEENVRRKDMNWAERCLNIAKIHKLKKRKNALEGEAWGTKETGELLGISKTHILYCLAIAEELQKGPDNPMWKEESLADAWRLLLGYEQEALQRELARRAAESSAMTPLLDYVAPTALEAQADDLPDLAPKALWELEARERYLANPLNDPAKVDEYLAEKAKPRQEVVYLTNRFYQGDSIKFMHNSKGMFDHVITDIPYAIDMKMLDQGVAGTVLDLETVIEEHDVDYNMKLIADFFPAAFRCMKESGFCITWCDQMVWQYMYDIAIKAGFKVQRWPVTWNKLHRCKNSSPQCNFTKSTEIAMVCRKGNAVLMRPVLTSVVSASNDEIKKLIDHPFAKPYEAWEFLVEPTTFQGQLILEPFAGRGSGVISMLRMNRQVMGCELDEVHYNALIENLKRYYLTLNPNFMFR